MVTWVQRASVFTLHWVGRVTDSSKVVPQLTHMHYIYYSSRILKYVCIYCLYNIIHNLKAVTGVQQGVYVWPRRVALKVDRSARRHAVHPRSDDEPRPIIYINIHTHIYFSINLYSLINVHTHILILFYLIPLFDSSYVIVYHDLFYFSVSLW